MLERVKDELNHTLYNKDIDKDYYEEWFPGFGDERINEQSWIDRYEYESDIISKLCTENDITKIIELGSGPGVLSSKILEKNKNISSYTLVDTPGAKEIFVEKKYKGKFFCKNMMNFLDITDLEKDYELVIANDFFEHIMNPSNILLSLRKITISNSKLFISVPNWRMGHSFIYRGLFDYDNWIYTLFIHGWKAKKIYDSKLKTEYSEKLDSEKLLPTNFITSWNWYFYCEKIN